jgi:hypothetical protein
MRLVWDGSDWVEPMPRERVAPGPLPTPMLMRDLPAYQSPLGDGWVDGRAARREHLRANNCREVDPGEWKRDPNYAAFKAAKKAAGAPR